MAGNAANAGDTLLFLFPCGRHRPMLLRLIVLCWHIRGGNYIQYGVGFRAKFPSGLPSSRHYCSDYYYPAIHHGQEEPDTLGSEHFS
jgi:hypothetical protein